MALEFAGVVGSPPKDCWSWFQKRRKGSMVMVVTLMMVVVVRDGGCGGKGSASLE